MYAKLSSTITRSSIWRESPATRCVWITLLALANKDGFVKGVEAWLASESNVSREECREALRAFMDVDIESQDQDYGGRRVEKVEGGWLVLNYPKYREMRTHEQVLASERQQRKRKRDKGIEDSPVDGVGEVTERHAPSRSVTASATASASESEGSTAREAADDWGPPDKQPAPDVSPDVSLPPDFLVRDASPHAPAADAEPPVLRERVPITVVLRNADHREAYLALRGKHRMPATLDATLREVHQSTTGGPGYAWDVIGGALLELLGNGESFNAARLRGYCRQVQRDTARKSAESGVPPVSNSSASKHNRSRGDVWDLCVRGGLTAPMQTRETLAARVQVLCDDGLVHDAAEFLDLVLAIQPWQLADIKFGKERDERLASAIANWRPQAVSA